MSERNLDVATAARRLDLFLAAALGCSRAAARRLIDEDQVRVDGKRARIGQSLVAGQKVRIQSEPPSEAALRPTPQPELPLDILFIDDAVVALNKPTGQPSQPLRAHEQGTLANALVARHPECAEAGQDPREGGLVQRLDSETSGVLLAARSRPDWLGLRSSFSGGAAKKQYLAVVVGNPAQTEGDIDAPVGHSRDHRRALAGWAVAGSRPAITHYRVLAETHGNALVLAESHSGRLHQIRVHLAHIGHPLVGDALYKGPAWPSSDAHHLLHAWRVEVPHPRTGAALSVTAPLPAATTAQLTELFGAAAIANLSGP